MKKVLSLALVLTLALTLLAVPATATTTTQSYFESNGFSVMQETPKKVPMVYAIWNPDNDAQFLVKNGDFTVDSCTVKPSAKKGYQDITLKTTAYLQGYYNGQKDISYHSYNWSNSFYDYYTGVEFNRLDIVGSVKDDYAQTITWGGRDYSVSYSLENKWTHGEWEWTDEENSFSDTTCESTYTFTVPTGYNGLVYCLGESRESVRYDEEEEVSTEVSYPDKADNGTYFRFGHKPTENLPREGLDIYIYDQDMGDPLGYNVTNHGTKTVTGYYALLSYWPTTSWHPETTGPDGHFEEGEYFRGQLLSLDVDLEPGESLKGDCYATAVGWSTMTHIWVRFDSKAERDAFYQNNVLGLAAGAVETGNNTYEIDMGNAGIQWMKDIFGIIIKSGKPN